MLENIEINQKELKQLLTDYYKKQYKDESVKITFKTNEEFVGIYENRSVVTRIKLKQNMFLDNYVISKEREISEEELKDVLNNMLMEKSYEVIDLFLDNHKYVDYYGYSDYSFDGVKLNVRKMQKQKIK